MCGMLVSMAGMWRGSVAAKVGCGLPQRTSICAYGPFGAFGKTIDTRNRFASASACGDESALAPWSSAAADDMVVERVPWFQFDQAVAPERRSRCRLVRCSYAPKV